MQIMLSVCAYADQNKEKKKSWVLADVSEFSSVCGNSSSSSSSNNNNSNSDGGGNSNSNSNNNSIGARNDANDLLLVS